jgi:hypothetical protein
MGATALVEPYTLIFGLPFTHALFLIAIAVLFNHRRFVKSEGAGARSTLVMKAERFFGQWLLKVPLSHGIDQKVSKATVCSGLPLY